MTDLFGGLQITLYYDRAVSEVQRALQELTDDQVLANSIEELTDHFTDKYLLEPLEEDPSRKLLSTPKKQFREGRDILERSVRHEIVYATIEVPLTPHANNQTTVQLGTSQGFVGPPWESLEFRGRDHTIVMSTMLEYAEKNLRTLRQQLGYTNADIAAFTPAFRPRVQALIERRKQQVESQQQKFKEAMTALGVEVVRKADAVEPVNVAIKRNVQVLRTAPPETTGPTDPYLSAESLGEILTLIHQAGKGFEASPSVYGKLGEEDLRTILLDDLNAVYGATAGSAETFSFRGHTDILLDPDGRGAVLIGECKIWGGAKLYEDTIDQLFGYVVWRHTAAMLITFSKNKGLLNVIAQGDEAIQRHPSYRGGFTIKHQTYRVSTHEHPRDAGKVIELHHLFFNLSTD